MPGRPQMATGPGRPPRGLQTCSFWWQLCFCSPNVLGSGTSQPLGWGCPVPRGHARHCRMQHGGRVAPSRGDCLGSRPGDTHHGDIPNQVLPHPRQCRAAVHPRHFHGLESVFFLSSCFHHTFPSRSPSLSRPASQAPGMEGPTSHAGTMGEKPAAQPSSSPPAAPLEDIFPVFFLFNKPQVCS